MSSGSLAEAASGAAESGLPPPRRYVAVAAVLAAIVLVVLDSAIANVALPSIAAAFQVTPAESVWVVTSYQLAVVVALLPLAALGESVGVHRVFAAGIVVFLVGSALCALSPSLPLLAAARFFQGLGGSAIMALGAALMRFTNPPRLLGSAIGWVATTVALSAAAGPGIGAAILSVADWPWLFAVNLPIGAVVLVAARALPRPMGSARPLDLVSAGLNAGMFAMAAVGADLLATRPETGAVLLAGAVLCLVALLRRERVREAPIFPIDLLRNFSFRFSVIASICCFAAQMISFVALPFYLQHGLGQDVGSTGLYMMPWPLTVAVAAPLAGRLANQVPTGRLCAFGGVCLAAALALAALWPLQDSLAPLVAATILAGLGFGFFQTPNNRNMLLSAPKARSGAAGGMLGTARLTGQTAGAVAMALLFKFVPVAAAPRIGLVVAAVLALMGGVVSLLRTRDEGA